jgi:hypothetical protein
MDKKMKNFKSLKYNCIALIISLFSLAIILLLVESHRSSLIFIISACAIFISLNLLDILDKELNGNNLNIDANSNRYTHNLSGNLLDYWVAKSLHLPVVLENGKPIWSDTAHETLKQTPLNFSSNWKISGPIIEANWAAIAVHTNKLGGDTWTHGVWKKGDLLEWLMVAFVASHYGQYIPCELDNNPTFVPI